MMMTLETYLMTLKHDKGQRRLKVVSLSGKQGAIRQVTNAEHCPETAIVKIKKLNPKKIKYSGQALNTRKISDNTQDAAIHDKLGVKK